MQSFIMKRLSMIMGAAFIGFSGCSLASSDGSPDRSLTESSLEEAIAPSSTSEEQSLDSESPSSSTENSQILWQGRWDTSDWMNVWQVRDEKSWGFENLEILAASEPSAEDILRVYYPAGSASPSVSRREGVALGGAQFYADLNLPPQERLRLSYRIRFSDNFDFVKGGKLPGLFGGEGASGGQIPDGTDGFSTRLMWRRNGDGEVYAYLPTSQQYGTSIGRGSWQFRPGEWTTVEQEVILNAPTEANGRIRLWVDDSLVIDESGLTFRTAESLTIDGIFFSTFFGGGDASWATPEDVFVDFADFTVSRSSSGNPPPPI